MLRKVPTDKSGKTPTRKPRVLKESAVTYKTRKRMPSRPIRYKPIPLKPEDWDKYRGETIAFVDDQILAHDLDLDKVLDEVWERFGKKPNEVSLLKVAMAKHKLL